MPEIIRVAAQIRFSHPYGWENIPAGLDGQTAARFDLGPGLNPRVMAPLNRDLGGHRRGNAGDGGPHVA